MEKHNCTHVLSKVFLVLDGEMSAMEEQEFLNELDSCSNCLERYHIEKQFKEFLGNKIARRTVSESLVQDIRNSINYLGQRGNAHP